MKSGASKTALYVFISVFVAAIFAVMLQIFSGGSRFDAAGDIGISELPKSDAGELGLIERDEREQIIETSSEKKVLEGFLESPPVEAAREAESPTTGTLFPHEMSAVENPTGIRICFVNNTIGDPAYLLSFSRITTEASVEGRMRLHPALADAYDENEPLLLDVEKSTQLAPLYPDSSIRLVLTTLSGIKSNPLEVELRSDKIVPTEINIGELFGE